MGGYKEVPDSEAGFDAIALSHSEYNKFVTDDREQKSEIKRLQKKEKDWAYKFSSMDDEIARLRKENKSYKAQLDSIGATEGAKDERIREYEMAVKKANEERKVAEELNENLKRICRERANAAHKITPKKDKSGYKVKSSIEKVATYPLKQAGKDKAVNFNTSYWETTILTPWDGTVDLGLVKGEINNFIDDKRTELGISTEFEYHEAQVKEIFAYEKPPETTTSSNQFNTVFTENFIFYRRFQNVRGYWELILYHTLPLKNVWKLETMDN